MELTIKLKKIWNTDALTFVSFKHEVVSQRRSKRETLQDRVEKTRIASIPQAHWFTFWYCFMPTYTNFLTWIKNHSWVLQQTASRYQCTTGIWFWNKWRWTTFFHCGTFRFLANKLLGTRRSINNTKLLTWWICCSTGNLWHSHAIQTDATPIGVWQRTTTSSQTHLTLS